MTRSNENKLNNLVTRGQAGSALTSEWLKEQGIDAKLVWWYVKSAWLERISNKLYKKVGDHVTWVSAVAAAQEQLKIPLHVGGRTALQLLGKAHYLPLNNFTTVDLFTTPTASLPCWLKKSKLWDAEFHVIKTKLFETAKNKNLGLTIQEVNGAKIQISTPERAIFEIFYQVDKKISYEEALQLMENLPYLRPKLIQELLNACSSIKTKRLFLHAAEKFQHEWLQELQLKNLNLGSGKSRIGEGGSYDAKYKLSVPLLKNET